MRIPRWDREDPEPRSLFGLSELKSVRTVAFDLSVVPSLGDAIGVRPSDASTADPPAPSASALFLTTTANHDRMASGEAA